MANNKFRENKYLNESGSKTGNWYMNRLDYFQFHQYPEYNKHKYMALLVGVLLFYLTIKTIKLTFFGALPLAYLSYVAFLSFNLLRTQVCKYSGYFLYPSQLINFFRAREITVDLNDFDSIATMSKK